MSTQVLNHARFEFRKEDARSVRDDGVYYVPLEVLVERFNENEEY